MTGKTSKPRTAPAWTRSALLIPPPEPDPLTDPLPLPEMTDPAPAPAPAGRPVQPRKPSRVHERADVDERGRAVEPARVDEQVRSSGGRPPGLGVVTTQANFRLPPDIHALLSAEVAAAADRGDRVTRTQLVVEAVRLLLAHRHPEIPRRPEGDQ